MIEVIDFIVEDGGAAATPQASGGGLLGLLPFVLIFVIFYFLLIRPQKKQQKIHQNMVLELKKGDRVVTSSGIFGKISSVKDKTFILTIAEKTNIEILKSQVATKYNQESKNG